MHHVTKVMYKCLRHEFMNDSQPGSDSTDSKHVNIFSVHVGGAKRIGHGVDIPWETNSTRILKYMADNDIVIEFCLTSNEFILGVKGVSTASFIPRST